MSLILRKEERNLFPTTWPKKGRQDADRIVVMANKPTIEEVYAHIAVMSDYAREILRREFTFRPDSRFGDNLLVALSTTAI